MDKDRISLVNKINDLRSRNIEMINTNYYEKSIFDSSIHMKLKDTTNSVYNYFERIVDLKIGNKFEVIDKDLMRFSDEIINENSLNNPENLIKEIENFNNFLKINVNLCNYVDLNKLR